MRLLNSLDKCLSGSDDNPTGFTAKRWAKKKKALIFRHELPYLLAKNYSCIFAFAFMFVGTFVGVIVKKGYIKSDIKWPYKLTRLKG